MANSRNTSCQVAQLRSETFSRKLFVVIALVALAYAFLAGLRTVTEFDLGWQLATGRWVAQHSSIPSVDIFSYTAAGQPWIYPVGSSLLFYGLFLLGGYSLLSWIGAVVCTATVALLLHHKSALAAILVIVAVPTIAARTGPRADMFSVLLFAAFLSILWQQRETGRAHLWLMPLLMLAWVNLHLGFIAGVALLAAYMMLEVEDVLFHSNERPSALARLDRAWPWLLGSCFATLLNPWGWRMYVALLRQQKAMASHAQWISEWASQPLTWPSISNSFSTSTVLLAAALVAFVGSVLQRRIASALLLAGATFIAVRHVRMQALFACVIVVVGGSALDVLVNVVNRKVRSLKIRLLAGGIAAAVCTYAIISSVALVTQRYYLGTTSIANFGSGLSWWFPQKAAAFIEGNHVPGNIFNLYNEGGYFTWRLGPKYLDYIDGRAIPFGEERFLRVEQLMQSDPDSIEWRKEADRYGINAVLVPLARYNGLSLFPLLGRFCTSQYWRPVFLDEVSAVFLRNTSANQALIDKFGLECASVRLPKQLSSDRTQAFNELANSAGILYMIGRRREAFEASNRALNIFPNSAVLYFIRAKAYADSGMASQAEADYLAAAKLEPNDAVLSDLAQLYANEGRPELALRTLETAAQISLQPHHAYVTLGEAYLQAGRPDEAIRFFDTAERKAPTNLTPTRQNQAYHLHLAQGRAAAFAQLGQLQRALGFQEQVVNLCPDDAGGWQELSRLYGLTGHQQDATRAMQRAEELVRASLPSRSVTQ